MDNRITKQSTTRPDIYMTVFTDQSGGYFSLVGGAPETLASLEEEESIKEALWAEYDELLHTVTRG